MPDDPRLSDAGAALLGLLSEEPMHAWEIERNVGYRDMRSWTDLSQSSIYRHLKVLEKAGFVTSDAEEVSGRLRRVFSIAPEGREALAGRLLEILGEPLLQKCRIDMATYNYDLVPGPEAARRLSAYREALAARIGCYREVEEFMKESGCPWFRLAVPRRVVRMAQAEMEWIDDFLAEADGR
ncbi:MAG TPA: PadR family transcriptional regulator [Candidatus Fermentibacter sp.]|nr:PadR family transcriptional regulator [Candidatus Fermentibacter sp.]